MIKDEYKGVSIAVMRHDKGWIKECKYSCNEFDKEWLLGCKNSCNEVW